MTETPEELCARLREIAEDGDTSDIYGNRVMRAVALIETLAKPASEPAREEDYDAIYNAIAAATKIRAGFISIDVYAFRAALSSSAGPAGEAAAWRHQED